MQAILPYRLFVGIDVGSQELVTCINDANLRIQEALISSDGMLQKVERFPQTKKGYLTLARTIRRYAKQQEIAQDDILIIVEATGNYWLPPSSYLYRQGFDITVINPSSARHYAKMNLQQSKSDPIDARTLSELGMVLVLSDSNALRLWHEPPSIYDELQQRVKLFSEISKVMTQTLNRHHARSWRNVKVDEVQARQKAMLDVLSQHKQQLQKEIRSLLFSNSEWRRNAEILMSIPGFGAIVTSQMLTITQNFTLFDTVHQLQSYCGLVPREYSSGKMQKHKRIGRAGNQTMRSLLFLAAQTASYRDPRLRAYKQRLTQEDPDEKRKEKAIRPNRGKPSTVAHIAVARKLVGIAWACIHNNTLYNPDH